MADSPSGTSYSLPQRRGKTCKTGAKSSGTIGANRTLQAFRVTYSTAQNLVLGVVKTERISLPALLLVGTMLSPESDAGLASDLLRHFTGELLAGDPRFSLHLITGLIGSALWAVLGERPLMIGPFPRPASAFQEIPPDRLDRLAREARHHDPEGAEFLQKVYLPLLREAVVHYFYVIPCRPERGVCFPRFEIFREPRDEPGKVREQAVRLISAVAPEEWEFDQRHEEESDYRLYIPRIARDVDRGAYMAGEEVRERIIGRIEEIRRRARAEGYPF